MVTHVTDTTLARLLREMEQQAFQYGAIAADPRRVMAMEMRWPSVMDNRLFIAYVDNNIIYHPDKKSGEQEEEVKQPSFPIFYKGDSYSLVGPECEGFDSIEREYEIVKDVQEINNIQADAVVVKQTKGDASMMFHLSKQDCAKLGIEYEKGLMLMPKSLAWKREKPKNINEQLRPQMTLPYGFNPNDLSTYPIDYHTHRVHKIICEIRGFSVCHTYNEQKYYRTPFGIWAATSEDIMRKMRFTTVNRQGFTADVPFNLATPIIARNENTFLIGDRLYVELDFNGVNNGFNLNELKNKSLSQIVKLEWKN